MHGGGAVGGGHGGGFGGGHHGGIGAAHHPGSGGFLAPPTTLRTDRKDPLSSPPSGPAGAPVVTPPGVRLAIRLYLASAAALTFGGLLATVVTLRLLHAGSGRVAAGSGESQATVGPTFVVIAVVTVLAVLGVKLLVAGRLRRGRNRARVAVLVLALWDLGATVLRSGSLGRQFSLGPLSATSLVLELVGLAALAVAAVLLFRSEANAWFRTAP